MNRLIVSAAIATVFATAACYTTKFVTFETFGDEKVDEVWVTRPDQSVVFVKDAQVNGDKLVGFVEHQYQELPAAELQQIKVRKLSSGRTAALVLGGAALFVGVAVMVSGTEDTFDGCVGGREGCYDDPIGP